MASPQLENGHLRIANELFDALIRTRINGEARQMLDCIIRKTYGFNKKSDQISTTQFMQATGLSRGAVNKARRKLIDMNMITISQKGNSQTLCYEIQKNYSMWNLSPKKEPITQKGNRCTPKSGRNYTLKSGTQNTKDNLKKTLIRTVPQKGDTYLRVHEC